MSKQDTSARYFEARLNQNPRSLIFSRLADGYRKNGEIQQAIGVCLQGLQNHPDYVTGRVILGRCYLEQEKLKDALAEFIRVIELDRRNQVALKMIADVFVRQGMKEKAGDLYSCLLRMDPDNQSLVKLAGTFRGPGDTNIQRILGIAGQPGNGGVAEELTEKMPDDIMLDFDKTIRIDVASRQPEMRMQDTSDLDEMLVKTQQFDANDLGAVAGRDDSAEKEAGVVTGDDINSRMAMMFDEEWPANAGAAEPEVLGQVDIGGEDSIELADTTPADDAGVVSRTDISSRTGQLSSEDIASRINEMFDEEPSVADQAQDGPLVLDVAADLPEKHDVDATEEINAADAVKKIAPHTDSDFVSGDDVALRLDTIFDEEPPTPSDSTDVSGADEVNQGFFTMSGENTETSGSGDVLLSQLDKVEVARPYDETRALAGEPEEETALVHKDGGDGIVPGEEETILSGSGDLPAAPAAAPRTAEEHEENDETAAAVLPPNRDVSLDKGDEKDLPDDKDEQTQAYSIPDHVLTPTLADIYFQQGQPRFALQIYKRLFGANPDNEKIAKRIQQIEQFLASRETEETVTIESARKKAVAPEAHRQPSAPKKKKEKPAAQRPLSGVRIKKKFKDKIRKMK
jgi:tetratricopeptide (TPR) repeat protein